MAALALSIGNWLKFTRELNQRGVLINERTVGKLYRQFLALLGGMSVQTSRAGSSRTKRCPTPCWQHSRDGEEAIIAALLACWSDAPHQRCQAHFLSNLSEPILELDTKLRAELRTELRGLPSVPEDTKTLADLSRHHQSQVAPRSLCSSRETRPRK